MDKKFREGLANATMTEFENVRNLRAEFIHCGADKDHITRLEDALNTLYSIFLDITRPEKD